MGNTTFTVRLADIQPVVPNESPSSARHSVDKHLDFAVNGDLVIGYDDRGNRHMVTLHIEIPEETMASVADVLNAETVTLSASVYGNLVNIEFAQGE